MTLWDQEKCNSSLAWAGKVSGTTICAGYYSGVKSICRVSVRFRYQSLHSVLRQYATLDKVMVLQGEGFIV
ncbi:hypothetical protein DPMN_155973 [Dreissena polymorpha]|uniref:Uncharacterized protein n=1 Tax=Dreissena polymorpha TaxID=45954 RepID=A0A9D4FNW9_DREPO|nr:hypothetical protein DPMN_155973 [Dreissena polymorpha]